MNRTVTAIDIIVIVTYLVATTLLGIWVGRRQKDAKDYFVAGRVCDSNEFRLAQTLTLSRVAS